MTVKRLRGRQASIAFAILVVGTLGLSSCSKSTSSTAADTTAEVAAETTAAPAETTAAPAETTAAAPAETTVAAPAETTVAAPAGDDIVATAKDFVTKQLSGAGGFDGPSEGPKAIGPGTIAFIQADATNGGINGVGDGVKEAAAAIGWEVKLYDGKASAQGRTEAINAAIAEKPAGIILGGFDAAEQKDAIKTATDQKIPVVGWHAGATPGPIPEAGLFSNVTTDPLEVSKIAAYYAIADSDGKAGVVILTDTQYEIAVKKADTMQDIIKQCKTCEVLSYENTPIAEADAKMPALVASLLQKYGDKLTYMLAINGNYYGGSAPALKDAGKDPAGPPKQIAAGDGDSAEFKRIRDVNYQTATVAEPLFLQGWQLVDELNRALSGAPASGYLAPPGLVTKANIGTGDVFDPKAPYRDNYKKIWGK
jgi:ribose transport system substrate-binding protein